MSNLNRIVRLPQVMDLTGLARSTIYAKISCNDFPGLSALVRALPVGF